MSDAEVERTEIHGEERASLYPREWGVPAGERFSEERVQWVRQNIELRTRPHHGGDPFLALLQLRRRVLDEHVSRLRELIARRRGPQ